MSDYYIMIAALIVSFCGVIYGIKENERDVYFFALYYFRLN
ncbi:hypothetical protein Q3F40_08625 [Enterococcus faecium]|nr:hypothetical protein [Enterococcus faecium]MDQ8470274.1 hypothetical protein [Enterococcus faecium]MDQ8473154.1 hypothetical protein [Enterococcus faecium]